MAQRLRIQHCCGCGPGRSCSAASIPGPGIATCCRCSQKKRGENEYRAWDRRCSVMLVDRVGQLGSLRIGQHGGLRGAGTRAFRCWPKGGGQGGPTVKRGTPALTGPHFPAQPVGAPAHRRWGPRARPSFPPLPPRPWPRGEGWGARQAGSHPSPCLFL